MAEIEGIRIATAAAGLNYEGRDDMTLFELAAGTSVSALTTQNQFAAAPVLRLRQNLPALTAGATTGTSYWLVNAGNANACTGAAGAADVRDYCAALGELAAVPEALVLPFSTGVIGVPLNMPPLLAALPGLLGGLRGDGWDAAADAIHTTDTRRKIVSGGATVGGQSIKMVGIAKGAAMIKPNMATMLSFAATDALVPAPLLAEVHRRAVDRTFNRICVEGDTSTNDCSMLAATGRAGGEPLTDAADLAALEVVLCGLLGELAEAIVADAEGAECLARIEVSGGRDGAECRLVADILARSVLLKTSLSSSESMWGRVLMALGYADLPDLDRARVSLWFGDLPVFAGGELVDGYSEDEGRQALSGREQRIRLHLGRGEAEDYALTCDLTARYVEMNSNYRT